MAKISSDAELKIIELLVTHKGFPRRHARNVARAQSPAQQLALLQEYGVALAADSVDPRRVAHASSAVVEQAPSVARADTSKVRYNVHLLGEHLEGLRALSEADGESVAYHIRAAIRDYLKRKE